MSSWRWWGIIEFRGVSYRHRGGALALDGIDLEIEGGELVFLVGANGAGKTTLLKHLNGLYKPTEGKVFVQGMDTSEHTVAELSRHVGVVFQNSDHQLFSRTVREEIAFGLRNFGFNGDVEGRVEDVAELMGIANLLDRSPISLSGGEKKRVCIAAAIAWDPEVLALDEPTVGQDHVNKERLHMLISKLKGRGSIIIIASHDVEFLWPLQPRVVVMAGGRILRDGPAGDVFADVDLIRRANLMQPQLAELSLKMGISPPLTSPKQFLKVVQGWRTI